MINYARLTLVCTEEEDPETLSMFNKSNFSVNKTFISFSVFGADHTIEHKTEQSNYWPALRE